MIKGFVIGDAQTVAKLQSLFPKQRAALRRVIQKLSFDLSAKVKSQKLSGQVLRVRTGTLRRSVHARLEDNALSIYGIVGTNKEYAAVHEYGGTFTISQHLRLVKQAFGRQLRFPVWASVKQYSATYPERSFLRSALREMRQRSKQEMEQALIKTTSDGLKP